MSSTVQSDRPFSYSVPASSTTIAASGTFALPTNSPTPGCSYTAGTFFSPEPGQILQAGQQFNVSYFSGSNITKGARSKLARIGISDALDSGRIDKMIYDIEVPNVTVTYGQALHVDSGQYVASWTPFDKCGNAAQNFTWTVPTNLTKVFPNKLGVDYQLFYVIGQVVNDRAQGGQFGSAFAITSTTPHGTPTPTPRGTKINSGSNSGGSNSSPDPQSDQGDGGLSGGAKAGIAVGAIVAATLVAGLAWVLWKKYSMWAIASGETWAKPELSAEGGTHRLPPVEIDGIPVVREADSTQIIWEPYERRTEEADSRIMVRDGSN